jgi:cytidylate kinase
MIVTIQRELGAGGLSIGDALASDLDATLLDERTIIDRIARRGGFSFEYLARVDERPPSFATSFMSDLARASALAHVTEFRSGEDTVLDEIRTLVAETAERGHVVLIGHGGSVLLAGSIPRDQLFSILLHARREWRIEQITRRFECSHEEATERVRRTDELRRKYVTHFFSADLYDARTYDLVMDTERIGIEAAKAIATAALRAALSGAS